MSFGGTARMLWVAMFMVAATRPGLGAPMRSGVTGGTIRSVVAGTDGNPVPCVVVVPDSFTILDAKFCTDRIVVAAWVEREGPGIHESRYLSEVWMFAADGGSGTPIAFEDRKVLLSRTSSHGESMTTYAYSLNCADATAVYDAGWEWGNVRLFDQAGRALPDIRPAVAGACECNPEYTTPIAWLELDRKNSLIMSVTDGGLGPYFVRWDLATGSAVGIGSDEIDAELFSQVSNAIMAERRRRQ